MDVLLSIVIVLGAAFLVGSVARFAVPGPDPMPAWLTIAIGLAGAFVGGLAFVVLGAIFAGGEAVAPSGEELSEEEALALGVAGFLVLFFVAVVGATILLILYRKLVQRRPLTGPEAQRPPLRPRGLGRILTRRPHRYLEETADPDEGWAPDQLHKLVLLRDAGAIDEAEFQRRRDALVERL